MEEVSAQHVSTQNPPSIGPEICPEVMLMNRVCFVFLSLSQFLQEHIDEFVEDVTDFACRLAKHRKSRTLEARDLQLHLQKTWNIRVPGYGDDPRPIRKSVPSPGHFARLQAVAKAQSANKNTKPRS